MYHFLLYLSASFTVKEFAIRQRQHRLGTFVPGEQRSLKVVLLAGPHAVPDPRQPGAPGHDDQDPRGLPTPHPPQE